MPLKTGVYSVIHTAAEADTDNYAYFQVYAGANTTATINGKSVTMIGGSTLDVVVKTIAGTDVYVLGDKIDVVNGSPTLSNYPAP
jgi:hypothetical protein